MLGLGLGVLGRAFRLEIIYGKLRLQRARDLEGFGLDFRVWEGFSSFEVGFQGLREFVALAGFTTCSSLLAAKEAAVGPS